MAIASTSDRVSRSHDSWTASSASLTSVGLALFVVLEQLAPGARALAVAAFTVAGGQIVAIDVLADPAKLRGVTIDA